MTINYIIQPGDSLSKIAKDYYGDYLLYEDLWLENKATIPNMNVVEIGQSIVLPDVLNGATRLKNTAPTSVPVGQVANAATMPTVAVGKPLDMNKMIRLGGIALLVVGLVGSLLLKKSQGSSTAPQKL